MSGIKRILVDMDGIIVDLYDRLVSIYNDLETHADGPRLSRDNVKAWKLEHFAPNLKVARRTMKHLDDPDFWLSLKPMSMMTLTALETWNECMDVHLVTSPWGGRSADAKIAWARQHLPFLKRDQITICSRKEIVHGDLLIDDKPATLRRYAEAWPVARLATIQYPYHCQGDSSDPVHRVPSHVQLFPSYSSPHRAWALLHEWVMENFQS